MNHNADLKPSLIDLEPNNMGTGGKQAMAVQPERLSERGNVYSVYWIRKNTHVNKLTEGYIGITCNFQERMKAHKKKRLKSALTDAIKKHTWEELIKEVLVENLTLEEALILEDKLRPFDRIGWNLLKGGILGVDKTWYNNPINKETHRIKTSEATIQGIKLKDSREKRSLRAKNANRTAKDAYKGSKNGRALLNEEQVRNIKFNLIHLSNVEIAKMYNVKPHVISFIRIGKNWKHITCDSPDYK